MANEIESLAKQLLSSSAVNEIAKKVGLSSKDVNSVLTNVLPDLLNGASAQATSSKTKESFLTALLDHSKSDISSLSSFFGKVDEIDGSKIINHLLGNDKTNLATKAAKKTGLKSEDVLKILAVAAPFLMTLMGKNSAKDDKKEDSGISFDSITNLLGSANISSLASSFLGNNTNKKDDGFGLDDVANIFGSVLKK